MKHLNRLWTIPLLFLAFFGWGQSAPLDSLINVTKTGDPVQQYKANYQLANKTYRENPEQAFEYIQKAKELAIAFDSALAIAATYQLQGVMYKNLGKSDSAISNYLTALKVYEMHDNTFGIASTSNDLGVLFKVNEEFENALRYYKKAYEGVKKIDHKVGITMTLNNIGTIKDALGELDSAEYFYTLALETASQNNIINGLALTYNNLGELAFKRNNHEKASQLFLNTLVFDRKSNDKIGMTYTYINLARTFYELGNAQEALLYIDSAIQQSISLDAITPLSTAYVVKSSILEKEEDYKNALGFHKNHMKLRDSIFNENKSQQLAELQTKYETEQKEQQIVLQKAQLSEKEAALLFNRVLLIAAIAAIVFIVALALLQRSRLKKKQQLKLQETALRMREAEIRAAIASQEQERSRYARDLHDGFGQMISILNMNLNSLQDGAKPSERQKVFEESAKVINEMYDELKNICFDLMPQTLIKHGLPHALKEFTDRINQAGTVHVELNVFGIDGRLTEVQEISLYRISQEWVNNILKYANADKVTLQITKDEGEITLLIEDNGNGFDKGLLLRGKGNGWKNLNTRTNLIHGELELETREGVKGTTLIVNAPAVVQTETPVTQNTVATV